MLADVVDLFLGVEAADAEANRRVRQLLADAERAQHVRRLERRRGARRARRHRDVLERHHQPLALDVREADVEVAGQPMLPRAVDVDFLAGAICSCFRADRAARSGAPPRSPSRPARQLRRLAEADDARHVERARAHAALVTAAVDLRRRGARAACDARTARRRPSGPYILCAETRRQVDLGLVDVERHLARAPAPRRRRTARPSSSP